MQFKLSAIIFVLVGLIPAFGQVQSDKSSSSVPEEPLLNAKALKFIPPKYPTEARRISAEGEVKVRIIINQLGKVISAKAISGPLTLRKASEDAALQAEFDPAWVQVETSGVLVYRFMVGPPPPDAKFIIRTNWTNIGVSLATLESIPTLRYFQGSHLAMQIPKDWIAEQNQLSRIEELKQAELNSSLTETPKEKTLSDGTTKVIIASPNKTAPAEAEAIGQSLIASLTARLGSRPIDLWYFNLGLEMNRALDKADSRDREIRMTTVGRFKDFIEKVPPEIDVKLVDELKSLYNLMEKGILTDSDKVAASGLLNKIMNWSRSE